MARQLASCIVPTSCTPIHVASIDESTVFATQLLLLVSCVEPTAPARSYDSNEILANSDILCQPIPDPTVRAGLAGIATDEIKAGKGPGAQVVGYVRKVKRWDKVKALELLGKDLGMFQDALTAQKLAELQRAMESHGISVEDQQPLNSRAFNG
jgi:hypothetical protein